LKCTVGLYKKAAPVFHASLGFLALVVLRGSLMRKIAVSHFTKLHYYEKIENLFSREKEARLPCEQAVTISKDNSCEIKTGRMEAIFTSSDNSAII